MTGLGKRGPAGTAWALFLVAVGGFCYGSFVFSGGNGWWFMGGALATTAQAASIVWIRRRKART